MLEQTGVVTKEQLASQSPSPERLSRGPVVIFECFQKIPCNPCVEACPRGAIRPMGDINDLPVADHEKCNGCGLCISACPGLAVFVVNMAHSAHSALVRLPYELRPVPAVGEMVTLLNRDGLPVGQGRVHTADLKAYHNRTAVVAVLVPKEVAMDVRSVIPLSHRGTAGEGAAVNG